MNIQDISTAQWQSVMRTWFSGLLKFWVLKTICLIVVKYFQCITSDSVCEASNKRLKGCELANNSKDCADVPSKNPAKWTREVDQVTKVQLEHVQLNFVTY